MKSKSIVTSRRAHDRRPALAQPLEQRRLLAAITSGQYVTGTLPTGSSTASYTFSANVGDSFFVTFADTLGNAFIPKVSVLKPDNTQLAFNYANTGATLEALSVTASGTYTLNVTDYNGVVAGSYALTMLKAPAVQPTDADSGPLTSGVQVAGSIDLGDADVYTFTANTGDSVLLNLADTVGTTLIPTVEVFTPNGNSIGFNYSNSGSNLEFLNLSVSGTYSVFVHDYSGNAVGNYAMTLVRVPASQPTDSDSGPVTSGKYVTGIVGLGDIDVYTFTASVGNNIVLNLGELGSSAFIPEVELFNPSGLRIGYNYGNAGSNLISPPITVAGTYTAVVHDYNGNIGGQYALTMAKSNSTQPNELSSGGDSGPISSGQRLIGNIGVGDVDIYTVSASTGQSLELSVGDAKVTTFIPEFFIYKPDGTLLDSSYGNNGSGVVETALTQAGTYTIFVLDFNGYTAGNYHIALTQAGAGSFPSADLLDGDGGALSNGVSKSGAITNGDQDAYTYNFTTGTAVTINVKDLLANSFSPLIGVFGPSGMEVDADGETTNSSVVIPANSPSGTYVVAVSDNSFANWGNYSIAVNATPAADTRSPNVTTARFDYAAVQQQVVLTTNENLGTSLGVGDLTLAFNGTPVDSSNLSASFNVAANEIIVQFPLYPFRALPDGNYTLTLGAGTVMDTAGRANASAYTYGFFSLAGDANHDRTVDVVDLGILASNYSGLGRSFAQGDFTYDGNVDVVDLGILATNYTKSVPAPVSVMPAKSTGGYAVAPPKKTLFAGSVASDVLNSLD